MRVPDSLMDQSTINALFERIFSKDATAEDTLYGEYHRLVRWVVAKRLPGNIRRRMDYEDLVQDIYIKLIRKARHDRLQWVNDLAFRAWLVTFSMHHVLKAITMEKRKKRNIGNEEQFETEPIATCEQLKKDLLRDLAEIVDDKERLIVELLIQGYSKQETAARVGIVPRTVKRTLDKLKKRIKELDSDLDACSRPVADRPLRRPAQQVTELIAGTA